MTEPTFPAPPEMSAWQHTCDWRSFIDRSPAVWRFTDNGHHRPALVLLPGALGDASSAWRLAEAFSPDWRVIAVTYPGGFDPEALADGLAGLLQDLGVTSCAVWSSSYGAWWAQCFARRHSTLVRALWLGNTFVDAGDVAGSPLFDAKWLRDSSGEEVQSRWHEALTTRPADELRSIQLHLLHHTLAPAQLHGRLRQVANAAALPPAEGVPTVLSDCADDPTIKAEVRARVLKRYSAARHVHFPIGGHYPHIVRAQPLIEAMHAWLARP